MKTTAASFILLLFVLLVTGQENPKKGGPVVIDTTRITLQAEILKFEKSDLQVRYTLTNDSGGSIFLGTNPYREEGTRGYYLLLDELDKTTLKVSSDVFRPPPYRFVYSDSTSVELKKILTNEKYVEEFTIKFPQKETTPPYYGRALKNRRIIPEEITKMELSLTYFPEEQGILDFLKTKRFGAFVSGNNSLPSGENKGKLFLDIKNQVSSGLIDCYLGNIYSAKNRIIR